MNDSGDLAIYIMQRIKEQTKYCGGRSDIVFLHHDGSLDEYMPGWPAYKHVEHMETWSLAMNVLVGQLLREASAGSNKSMEDALELVRQHLKSKPKGVPDAHPRVIARTR